MKYRIFMTLPSGEVWWLRDDYETWSSDKALAGLFDETTAEDIVSLHAEYGREPWSEAEYMTALGSPRLF